MPERPNLLRADFARERVQGIQGSPDKYRTQLVKLPARLHTNGLGQTVAFYLSVGAPSNGQQGKPEWVIMTWLEDWLVGDGKIYSQNGESRGRKLIQAITGGTDGEYRLASAEARALANWLKSFAEAFLATEGGGDAE